ncbi:MAG: endonuclease YncB(thermonuclease family) [Myxococcota bacterium]|jgi:endonuclease YncB( thermonuclease family)
MSKITKSQNYSKLLIDLQNLIKNSKSKAEEMLRKQAIITYWNIGKRIEEEKIDGDLSYQSLVIKNLSEDLQINVTTIRRSIQFFKTYPQNPPIENSLNWSHYRILLTVNDLDLREDLTKQAGEEKWKVSHLNSQIQDLKKEKPPTYSTKITRPTKANYLYKAKIIDVVDGDTLVVNVDLGFGINKEQRIRLAQIDAAEMKSEAGQKAAKYLRDLALDLEFVVIRTNKVDIFGRYIGDVFYPNVSGGRQDKINVFENGIYLNERLLEAGFAKMI